MFVGNIYKGGAKNNCLVGEGNMGIRHFAQGMFCTQRWHVSTACKLEMFLLFVFYKKELFFRGHIWTQ
jgi:hypothetical protein